MGGVYIAGYNLFSHTHLVLTNLLITSLLVLCFSHWFLLFLPPESILISCRPIDSHFDICYLGTYELIIFVSFLWMIWVNLPFWSIYLSGSAKHLSCGLCGKSDSVTFGHSMGGCPWVLNVENKTTPSEDRYTWRHNNVLRVLCNAIVRKVQQRNRDSQKDTAPGIHFVKEKATASTISSA